MRIIQIAKRWTTSEGSVDEKVKKAMAMRRKRKMNGQKKSKWNLEIVARNSYSLYFAGAVAIPNTNRPENNNYENNFELSLNFKCDVVRSLVDIFHCMRCGGSKINQGVYTLYQAE